MQRKANLLSLVRFFIHTKNEACCTRRFSCRLGLFISWRTNLYLISGKDKKKSKCKDQTWEFTCSLWNMIDAITSLCGTFMTTSFPKIQRNITSKRRNCLAKRCFSSSHLPAVSETIRNTDSVEHFNNVDRLSGASQEFKGFTSVLLLPCPLRSLQDSKTQE